MSDNVDLVGQIMDLAAVSDRRALFAGLQAALGEIANLDMGRGNANYDHLLWVLKVGAEAGSPERLAAQTERAARLQPGDA